MIAGTFLAFRQIEHVTDSFASLLSLRSLRPELLLERGHQTDSGSTFERVTGFKTCYSSETLKNFEYCEKQRS